ncbi:MAG: DNA polymerase III subunit alpha, partial [Candidatus Dormibacteria bacterium]
MFVTDSFVHLHTHSEFSLLDGAARIGELVETARAMEQPAIAITDHGVLYGAVDFYSRATAAGVKPVIGCEMYMAPRSRHDRDARSDRDPSHLVLLAASDTGYRNLIRLVSTAHLEGHYYKPRIDKELLAANSEGLICLSACLGGELPQAILRGNLDAAEAVARQHAEILGPDSYFLELQDHGIDEEATVRDGIIEIARRTGLPLVCTNDSHYIRADDAEAHDILLCLQTGARREEEKRFKFYGPDFYLAGTAEMRQRFERYGEALRNTVAIAERCNVELQLGRNLLPTYQPIPDGHDADTYLAELCQQGLLERYGDAVTNAHRERLTMELDVIRETGFSAYFLIVWDLIRAARCNEVRVGPGRGSAAGSLVAYVLRITNIEPLGYGLIFERFLNRERVQMPDIDIDFDDRRRDRVLRYVQDKYGHDRVAQIITFGTMAARAAIRDVGRVLNVPLPDVDRLAKLVPPVVNITLERALSESRELRDLYEQEEWATRLIDNAKRLEGIARNASTHAAGVVIGSEPLVGVVPLQRATSGDAAAAVTQFDMNGVSRIGLLKIDLLGLSNLTVLDEAAEHVRNTRGLAFDLDAIPLDDSKTYELLGRADAHGVFQMEGTFAKRILIDIQPRSIEDLAVANALNRPGPIEGGVVDTYMRRKRGEEDVAYMVPEMEPILKHTYGTIIYQDQVMQIASAVAGFTLGEADVLRAAMGKKDKVKMDKQREKFLAGAAERGVAEQTARELFDLIAYFAGYGFGAAHASCYALIGYQTAYMKANFPLEFMCALLNNRADNFDKLKLTILDAHARGLVVRPPDVNRSGASFSIGEVSAGEILYGLGDIKNVGERVADAFVAAREEGGPYASLLGLCLRVATRDLNRRVVEALIK